MRAPRESAGSPRRPGCGAAVLSPAAVPGGLPLLAVFVASALAHRVANIMLLVPLRAHTYVLSLVTGLVQLTAYSSICWLGMRRGRVTKDMQSFAAQNYCLLAAIGMCEGVFYPLVMYSASRLPGGLVQVLQQTVVPATVLFSAALLGRRYSAGQLAGVLAVLAGMLSAVAAQGVGGMGWAAWRGAGLCAAAYALLALGVTLKDAAFTRFRRSGRGGVGGPGLDVSLVCAAAAAAQVTIQVLAWPVLRSLAGTGSSGGYGIREGVRALAGVHEPLTPLLAVTYWSCSVGFSFAALRLVRQASAATVVLANVIALPLSALVFCCPLPLLERQAFHWGFVASLAMVVAGNVLFGWAGASASRPGRS